MTNVTDKQAPNQVAMQKPATEQPASKSATADGKKFLPNHDTVHNMAQTSTSATKTTATTTTITGGDARATVQYDVEHLATFSTASSHEQQVGAASAANTSDNCNGGHRGVSSKVKLKQATTNDSSRITEPKQALQRLFELEKLSGIWTQRMQIELQQEFMLIVDCETDSVVERFHRDRVTKPDAFSHYNDIYNNIVVFNIDQLVVDSGDRAAARAAADAGESEDCDKVPGELHIFQCVSHQAKQLVSDILAWKSSEANACGVPDERRRSANDGRESAALATTNAQSDKVNPATGTVLDGSGKEADWKSFKDRSQEVAGGEEMPARKATTEDEPQPAAPIPPADTSCKPVVTVASCSKSGETLPIVNVNVKETVQVFNQIAALREKSNAVGQAARPLSDGSNSSQTGSASSQQQQQQSSPALASGEFSRALLGPNGQSYKQRSIRVTLAPKRDPNKDQNKSAPGAREQDLSASSSSSMASSGERANNGPTKFAPGQPDHLQRDSPRDSSGQASSSSASSSSLATKTNHHDATTQQPLGQKHTAGHGNGGNDSSHTPPGSSSHHHHHNHNHHQQALVKGKSSSNKPGPASSRLPATNGHHHQSHHGSQGASLGIQSSNSSSGRSHGSSLAPQQPLQQQQQIADQVTSNESYVSVLNHCFDDIEKFILRIQHAYAALRELQAKKRLAKRSAPRALGQSNKSHLNGGPPLPPPPSASELAMLSAQARGPSADDFFEILSKFKLAFNLLAKLKGCIHEPNAPELVHFLFTPLAIIIESARNVTPPVDPSVVGVPYLNTDALELLSNCCTSKESDLWLSLGPNWTETIDAQLLKASRLPSSFQPIFSDGWAPVINELELIGLVAPSAIPGADFPYGVPRATAIADEPRPMAHGQAVQPLTLPPMSNGALTKTKRTSPSGANSRYADPMMQSGYLRETEAPSGPLNVPDGNHPLGSYRVPEMHYAYNNNNNTDHRHSHKSSRHSLPPGEKSSRAAPQYSSHGVGSRRKSDYVGQYAPPMMLNSDSIELRDEHLDGRYSDPPTNPSDDYTELQNDPYLAGPSARHADDHSNYAGPQLIPPGDQPRRRAQRSSYNRRYLNEPHYKEHGPDLMVHEIEREAMLVDLGPSQTEWFYELKLRGALIVRVLFTREANNDKELTVKRGEILEILDDTRKWWKARNIDLQVAYVPHTIVAVMEHYQTLDELLTGSAGDMLMMINEDQTTIVNSQRYAQREQLGPAEIQSHHGNFMGERRNSKTAKGAFRYF